MTVTSNSSLGLNGNPRLIVHISTGLEVGGAENILSQLVERLNPEEFYSQVVSLTEMGPMAARIASVGVKVDALEMRAKGRRIAGFARLRRYLRETKPAIVQTWLYHADLIGGFASVGLPTKLVWNLRQSNLHSDTSKGGTRLVAAACAPLSHILPDSIVCGSQSASEVHATMGYSTRKMVVIKNGVDLNRFKPQPQDRIAMRRELGVEDRAILVGMIARFDPQKDHETFVDAASKFSAKHDDVHFVLCGTGINKQNAQLLNWINRGGRAERFHLLGIREDIPVVTAALDLLVSSSAYGEGIANTLLEALACGVPVVATEVGDARDIVGDSGRVVPPGNSECLLEAFEDVLINILRDDTLSRRARERAEGQFDMDGMVENYERLYRQLLVET